MYPFIVIRLRDCVDFKSMLQRCCFATMSQQDVRPFNRWIVQAQLHKYERISSKCNEDISNALISRQECSSVLKWIYWNWALIIRTFYKILGRLNVSLQTVSLNQWIKEFKDRWQKSFSSKFIFFEIHQFPTIFPFD